jgi:Mce-associated membrane protein
MKLALLGLGAALVAAGLFLGLWLNARTTSSAEIDETLANEAPEVREIATEIVELLVNLDAAKLEERSERVLELSTGNFRSDYESLLPGLGPAFEESGAKATGEIVEGPDVTFSASDEAFAIAKVAQTTIVDHTERTVGFTVRLTMVMQGERWKADRFELLGEL